MLSIVTTVFRSEKTIGEFIDRVVDVAENVEANFEIIVVDDGSPDQSAELVRNASDKDHRIVLVQLSRNFGHHRALLAGLEHSSGDRVLLIDSDLEEAPENLPAMLAQMTSEGADCVYGVQLKRKGSYLEQVSGQAFYGLFNMLSGVRMPLNVSTIRVMTRRYVKSLLLFRDRNPVFIPLSLLTGYKQTPFAFTKESTSETTYSMARRLSLMLLAITSFSGRPLYILFGFCLILSLFGLSFCVYVAIRAMTGSVQSGWPSLMAAMMFFFSVNALFTGVIGLYVKLILEEVKERPRTIVQEVYRGNFPEPSKDPQ